MPDSPAGPADVAGWYRLDETVDPPVYRLRRDRAFPPDVTDWLVRFWESKGLPLAGESITAPLSPSLSSSARNRNQSFDAASRSPVSASGASLTARRFPGTCGGATE